MKHSVLIALIMLGIAGFAKNSYVELVTTEMLATLCNYNSFPQKYKKFAKDSCNGTIRAYLEYNVGLKNHYKLKVPFCRSNGVCL